MLINGKDTKHCYGCIHARTAKQLMQSLKTCRACLSCFSGSGRTLRKNLRSGFVELTERRNLENEAMLEKHLQTGTNYHLLPRVCLWKKKRDMKNSLKKENDNGKD
jgi:hypothetical protein